MGIVDCIVFVVDFFLEIDKSLYFVEFGDKVNFGIYKEGDVVEYCWKIFFWYLFIVFDSV